MAPRQSVDDKLAALEQELADASDESLGAVIDEALAASHYRIVALAANHAREALVYGAVPALIAAWPGLLDKPAKRDPGCYAKKAIIRALYELDCDDVDFYLAAVSYRQPEPVWGGTADTATDIRCTAALGLVSSGYSRALIEVAELLIDEEEIVRAGAAKAIACGNPREAELLLRAKLLTGDEEPGVYAECFEGLLTVEPDESPDFVARFLNHEDEAVCEAAALALGESRLPDALAHLIRAWDDAISVSARRVLVRAAALHRSDDAFDWLLGLIDASTSTLASEVIDVLAIYQHNTRLADRVREALQTRADENLMSYYEKVWA